MRILLLSDNYPPETNAPAARTSEHAALWAAAGHQVTVITCAPNYPTGRVYPGYRNVPLSVTWQRGVRVIRIWTYMAPNAGFFRRILDFVSFAMGATVVGTLLPFDVLVATSPQFFTAVAGGAVGLLRRKPWVFEVRDLWPESIRAVGAMGSGRAFRILEAMELFLYQRAARVVVVTRRFRANLISRRVRSDKVFVVPNGANTKLFKALAPPRAVSCQGRMTVGYVGTHGMAHGLDFVLGVARKEPAIRFMFVGEGAEKRRLIRLSGDLHNVKFLNPVPKTKIPDILSSLDYALVNLKDTPTFRTVIPSKIFESAAMGVPILIGVDGEAREIIDQFGAGLFYEPENPDSFRAVLRQAQSIRETPEYEKLQDGCRRLAAAYDRRTLAEEMLKIIGTLQR